MADKAKYFISGGAGFIGSHAATYLFNNRLGPEDEIVIYDNFCSGQHSYISHLIESDQVTLVNGDLKALDQVVEASKGTTCVYHFAANPDIARAIKEPEIDFWEGTYLLHHILEACRINEIPRLIYSSGSGVYGDAGSIEVNENYAPMQPISTYGASKLGCEALISSYCHMFDLTARAFRFANVVGPRQTHGVTYDFVRNLNRNPSELKILGDGSQSKSYIYIDDVLNAIMLLSGQENWDKNFDIFNVGTDSYITVTEIAELVVRLMKLDSVEFIYQGGKRGWKGDVPIVRLNTDKIRSLGWSNKHSSSEALELTILSEMATVLASNPA